MTQSQFFGLVCTYSQLLTPCQILWILQYLELDYTQIPQISNYVFMSEIFWEIFLQQFYSFPFLWLTICNVAIFLIFCGSQLDLIKWNIPFSLLWYFFHSRLKSWTDFVFLAKVWLLIVLAVKHQGLPLFFRVTQMWIKDNVRF